MRKFTKSLMALVLLIGGTTTANASLQPGTRYTSVDQLSGKVFAIVNEADGKAFYGSGEQNVAFDAYATAFTNDVYYFKLVDIPADKLSEDPELAGYTLIRACNADGSFYTFWDNSESGYLNANGWCVFVLGIVGSNENPKTLGQDFDYAAVWKVTYVDGEGFTIQNKYTGNYLKDAGSPNNADPTYFSFCTVGEPSHMLHFTNGEAQLNYPWAYTANYTLSTPLTAGTTYVFEAIINAVNGGATRLVNISGSGTQYLETKGLWANEFTRYHIEFTADAAHDKLEIDLGECGGDVYIDNVSLKVKNTDTNLIANGDFETEGTDGWSAAGNTMERVEKVLDAIKDPGILISVGEAGWRTFRTGSTMEITDPNVKAYVAKYVSEGNYVKLTEVTKVPEWEPVLIEAPRGNYQANFSASADGFPYSENDLQVNGGSELTANGTQYGLGKVDGVVGFYRISDKVPAWKIYLEISGGAPGAPEFLGFGGDDMTGIDMVKGERFKVKGEFYNLKGQRVAQPTKGLYIVNGKKVVIK